MAQDPEISTMTGWPKVWGEEVPEAGGDMDPLASGHSGMAGLPGMMGDEDRAELERSSATEKSAQNAEISEMDKLLGKSG
ncbi:DUF305 domain-containing protein [Streptomyces swartbergensis]|uniref:hypothetical protein n=1 Tax=Streptomyces swartbergensis TaxID=487165 RepID=UPI0038262B74